MGGVMNVINEAKEWSEMKAAKLDFSQATKHVDNLLKEIEKRDKLLMEIKAGGSISCTANPDSPPCYLIDGDMFNEALSQLDKESK